MGKRRRGSRDLAGPSLAALAGVVVAGPIGYLVAESTVVNYVHPLLWLVTIVVAFVGYWDGEGWHRLSLR